MVSTVIVYMGICTLKFRQHLLFGNMWSEHMLKVEKAQVLPKLERGNANTAISIRTANKSAREH